LEANRPHEKPAPQEDADQERVIGAGVLQFASQPESEFVTNVVLHMAGADQVSAPGLANASTERLLRSRIDARRLSETGPGIVTSQHLVASLAATGQTSIGAEAMKRDIHAQLNFDDTVIGSVTTVGSGLAVGYAVWAIRGGMLLSGLLAQMPVWTILDPLLFVDRAGSPANEGDSLADIVDGQSLHRPRRPPGKYSTASES
jgi:hypothetical protein